ncbi:MAG: response regulator transcription factor, partial [Bacteroidales bacterium]|nr:response regulator transcription factor [Bacteroidales bacterium]
HQQGMIAAKRGNFRQAANYLREGLTLSRQTGELLLQRNITRDLAVMLKDADPREAVSYMQEVLVLSDTLFHQEMTRQMAELAIQNDLALKEHTIALQEETLNMRRKQIWILIGLLVLLLALALVMMRLIFIHKRDKKLLQQASDIKDKLIVLGGGSASPKDAEEVSQLLKKLSESGSSPLSVLTAREREIALLCSKGLVNKEIADRLALSLRTVETHKNNIFRKLGINSTAELVDLLQAESK